MFEHFIKVKKYKTMAKGSNYPNENVFNKKKIYWILSKFAWFINHKWHLNLTVLEKKICFQKKCFAQSIEKRVNKMITWDRMVFDFDWWCHDLRKYPLIFDCYCNINKITLLGLHNNSRAYIMHTRTSQHIKSTLNRKVFVLKYL